MRKADIIFYLQLVSMVILKSRQISKASIGYIRSYVRTCVFIGAVSTYVHVYVQYYTCEEEDKLHFWDPSECLLKDSNLVTRIVMCVNSPKHSVILLCHKGSGYPYTTYMTVDHHVIKISLDSSDRMTSSSCS